MTHLRTMPNFSAKVEERLLNLADMASANWSAPDHLPRSGRTLMAHQRAIDRADALPEGAEKKWAIIRAIVRVENGGHRTVESAILSNVSLCWDGVTCLRAQGFTAEAEMLAESAISLGLAAGSYLGLEVEWAEQDRSNLAAALERLKAAKAGRRHGAKAAALAKGAKWKPWVESRFRDIRERRPDLSLESIASIIQEAMGDALSRGEVAKVVQHRSVYDHVRIIAKNHGG